MWIVRKREIAQRKDSLNSSALVWLHTIVAFSQPRLKEGKILIEWFLLLDDFSCPVIWYIGRILYSQISALFISDLMQPAWVYASENQAALKRKTNHLRILLWFGIFHHNSRPARSRFKNFLVKCETSWLLGQQSGLDMSPT